MERGDGNWFNSLPAKLPAACPALSELSFEGLSLPIVAIGLGLSEVELTSRLDDLVEDGFLSVYKGSSADQLEETISIPAVSDVKSEFSAPPIDSAPAVKIHRFRHGKMYICDFEKTSID